MNSNWDVLIWLVEFWEYWMSFKRFSLRFLVVSILFLVFMFDGVEGEGCIRWGIVEGWLVGIK